MSGLISSSGLITGIDSGALIEQLMALERQPILRLQDRIATLETERDAVRDLRTQLLTLRNRLQDFRLFGTFDAFQAAVNEESVLTAEVSSSNPVVGAFEVNVTQLASATVAQSSAVLGSPIDPAVPLDSSGMSTAVEAGTFTINGVEFTVDPATQSLNSVLSAINSSAAGVTATYDNVTDTVTFENTAAGDTSIINFGGEDDDSNFLDALSVTQATQSTGGSGSTIVTSTRNLGAVDAAAAMNTVNFAGGAVTTGVFSINGVSISVDPTADSMSDILDRINGSDASVTASYDASSDAIRVVSDTLGSRTVKFGGAGDTSNFLSVMNLDTAVQTAGSDAQFTINGGSVLTRNTNEISDAISGVTINLLSTGTSTVTVSSDNDAIVEDVQAFIDEFNNSVNMIRDLTAIGGTLYGDGGIRSVQSYLLTNVFNQVFGIGGDFSSLVEIGITTGDDFDSSATANLVLDGDVFREALRDNRANVEGLFTNSDGTGIADVLFSYLDDATQATGFLNGRSKANGTIDQEIRNLNDQIDRYEDRLSQRELRLRRQFAQLEQYSAALQSQNAALSALGSF